MTRHRGMGRTGHGGQTAAEYALLAAALVVALVGMQIYLKRSLSGQLRQAADSVGEQYDPRNTTTGTGGMTLTVSGTTTTTSTLEKDRRLRDGTTADVIVTTTTIDAADPDKTTRTGTETVGKLGTDLWE